MKETEYDTKSKGNQTSSEKEREKQQKIARIMYMEKLFNKVSQAIETIDDREELQEQLHQEMRELVQYYESEQWREDFEADHQGMFPEELHRGVLSEDGIYNLIGEIEEKTGEVI